MYVHRKKKCMCMYSIYFATGYYATSLNILRRSELLDTKKQTSVRTIRRDSMPLPPLPGVMPSPPQGPSCCALRRQWKASAAALLPHESPAAACLWMAHTELLPPAPPHGPTSISDPSGFNYSQLYLPGLTASLDSQLLIFGILQPAPRAALSAASGVHLQNEATLLYAT